MAWMRHAKIDRRDFIKGAAGTAALFATHGLSAPALAQGAARTLKFVPQADLANFDPIWGTQYVVRNAAALVWDTLYGVDDKLVPQRQMVENETTSADGLVWTFKLRSGLKFHDGEPVRARDVVASIARWSARDAIGRAIKAIQQDLVAVDDLTFRWQLTRPFPRMLFALGKNNSPCCFIMPERIAVTDPFKQITEHIGSGPMRFKRDEWTPGARAVFERFDGYVPRQEKASWMAGGKIMSVDRIEWLTMPDPATASAALLNGEIDWWETPIPDLIPLLKKNSNVVVDIADPLGNIGAFRMNHLQPPFNDVRVRRAILMSIKQEDYMRAVVGSDELWRPTYGYFTPGTPLYTEEGADLLKGPRDIEGAKRLIAEAGFAGHSVTCLIGQDYQPLKAMGEVTADMLTKLGFKLDFVSAAWGSVGARRVNKGPPSEAGWNMFHTYHAGGECFNPATNTAVRANGDAAWFGWPTAPEVEKEVAAWFDAKDLDEEKAVVRRLNKAAIDNVVYGPTGFFLSYQAWRKNIAGVAKGPLPVFWGVSKTV
jgi:peptide/nickel transport system substrate-binding protein